MTFRIFTDVISSCLIAVFFSCSSVTNQEKKNDITGIKVTENFPILDPKGKLIRYDIYHTNIYYYKDLVLYKSDYGFDSVVNDITFKQERRDYYFVYRKGNNTGLLFDSNKHIFEKRVLTDSILNKEWCNGLNFYRSYADNLITPISSNEIPDSGIVKKMFSFKGVKDTGLSGIVSFWFSNKLNHIEYSLSKELDSIYKKKLYKIRITNNPRKFDGYDFALERIDQAFDLEEIPVTNKKELLKYFEKIK
jgi:hypothetical protein